MKALIFQDTVIQVAEDEFPVAPAMQWVECFNIVKVGDKYVDGNFVAQSPTTEPTLQEVKQARLAELATFRYHKEIGGLTLNGYFIATDDRSKTLLLGARMLADTAIANNVNFSIDWKTENGFQPVNAQTIVALSNAMSQFVQHCFTVEAGHSAMINSLTTIEAVKGYSFNSGW